MRYRETSKIVRLATRDAGVLSVIAKGAFRPKSRFGASLQPLSDGIADIYLSEHRDLHTLGEFELTHLRTVLATSLDRYAAAVALAELMLRFAPAAPHPEIFDLLGGALSVLETAPLEAVEAVAISMLWRLVSELGFAPSLDVCARDGTPLDGSGDLLFSAAEGGAVCGKCARAVGVTRLGGSDRTALYSLISPGTELPDLDSPHGKSHRRLLDRYIRYHVADGAELPALKFWTNRETARA